MWGQLIRSDAPVRQAPPQREATLIKGPRSTKPVMTMTILRYIEEHPGCSSTEIRLVLKLSSGSVLSHLYRMEKDGRIRSALRKAQYRSEHSVEYIKHYWRVQ